MKRSSIPQKHFLVAASLVASLLGTPSLFAADITWNSGNYTGGNFSIGANWVGGVAPGASDVAVFNNQGDQIITVGNATALGGMLFSSNSSFTNSYVFNVGTNAGFLTTPGAVIQTDSSFRGIVGIAVGTGGSDQALSLNGSLTLSSNGLAGSGIVVNRITTRPNSGSVTLTLDGSNSGFRAQYGNTLLGAISQNATNSTLSVVKNGTGTWVLGNNTYTGGTTINAGTLVVTNAASMGTTGNITIGGNSTIITTVALTDPSSRITINDGATLTVDTAGVNNTWAGVLGNSGSSNTAGLTKTGLGQLALVLANGAKQTYKGDTTINSGLFFVDGASQTSNFSNLIDSSSRLVLGGGSLYYRGNNTVSSSQTFASTTLNPGVSEFRAAASSGTNVINFGTITRNAGSLLYITTAGGYSYTASGTANSAGGLVKGVINGNDFVTNNGTNLVFSTYTLTSNASLWTNPAANYSTNGAVTGSVGNATINSLRFANASNQNVTITGTLAVNDGIIFTSTVANNSSQISGGNLTGSSGGGDLIIVNNNNRNQLGQSTISSTIVDNGGTTGLVLLNSGTSSNTMYLTGNNSYTGNTTIGGGTNASSSVHAVVVGGAAGASIGSSGATVLINGGTGGAASGANVLRVGNNDATGNVLGTINIQNGRLSLNRNDTYTLGATVGGTSGMGLITLDSAGNATVNLASGTNSFASLAAPAAGTLNLSGSGIYNFNSAWTGFNAGSTINYNSGTYYFAANANTANVLGNQVINGASVTLAGGRYWGSGGGNLTLNSGSFKVNGTSINMENNGANSAVINVNGGTFIATPNTNNGSLSALALGGGTITSTGNATFNQSGGNVNIGVPENNLVASSNSNAGLAIGAGNATTTSSHTSTYNLSGGTLRVFGAITGSGNASFSSGTSNFNWTGGTLTASTYNGTNLLSNGTNNTLIQNGASTVMAPGDFYEGTQFTGRTAITGNYTINSGTVSFGLGGTTAATSFHTNSTGFFDNITVSGATVLGGSLAISLLNGFVPTELNSFIVLDGVGLTSGAFTNVAFGDRLSTLGGEGTFLVSQIGNDVMLSQFVVIPEPSTYALGIIGLLGVLALVRQRRRMKSA